MLEEQRRYLNRAIRALEAAEAGLESSAAGDAALESLMEVIGMQDSIDEMRKYYRDDVWDSWRRHYEEWPSQAWRDLYRDVNALLDSDAAPDPMSEEAQALGVRWLALDKGETSVGAVRTGLRKAWADRAVRRWQTILDAECGGDRETMNALVAAWRSRALWTPAMRRYMASCYAMDGDTWRRAASLLETAYDLAPR